MKWTLLLLFPMLASGGTIFIGNNLRLPGPPGFLAVDSAARNPLSDTTITNFDFIVSGTDKLLLVSAASYISFGSTPPEIASVTFGGNNLSLFTNADLTNPSGYDGRAGIWYLINPPDGTTDDLIVTFDTGAAEFVSTITLFTNVHQSDPFAGGIIVSSELDTVPGVTNTIATTVSYAAVDTVMTELIPNDYNNSPEQEWISGPGGQMSAPYIGMSWEWGSNYTSTLYWDHLTGVPGYITHVLYRLRGAK